MSIRLENQRRATVALTVAANVCDVEFDDIKNLRIRFKSRPDVVRARTIAVACIRATIPNFGCKQIAKLFGFSDHTSALFYMRRGERERVQDWPDYQLAMGALSPSLTDVAQVTQDYAFAGTSD